MSTLNIKENCFYFIDSNLSYDLPVNFLGTSVAVNNHIKLPTDSDAVRQFFHEIHRYRSVKGEIYHFHTFAVLV